MIITQTTIDMIMMFQNNALIDPNWFGFQVSVTHHSWDMLQGFDSKVCNAINVCAKVLQIH